MKEIVETEREFLFKLGDVFVDVSVMIAKGPFCLGEEEGRA